MKGPRDIGHSRPMRSLRLAAGCSQLRLDGRQLGSLEDELNRPLDLVLVSESGESNLPRC